MKAKIIFTIIIIIIICLSCQIYNLKNENSQIKVKIAEEQQKIIEIKEKTELYKKYEKEIEKINYKK